MSQDSWKFVLGAYRPGAREANDPAFVEALAAMDEDPGLRDWFRQDQAFGTAVRAKLAEVNPPPDLRMAILTGARISREIPWWRRASVLAMAASIAILLAVSPLAWRALRPGVLNDLPKFAVQSATRGFVGLETGQMSPDLKSVQAWLAARRAPLPARIPPALAQLHLMGCGTIAYEGKNISVICFEKGREYHLFVARRTDFPGLESDAAPHFASHRGWGSAMWSDTDHDYVLVSSAGVPAIRSLL